MLKDLIYYFKNEIQEINNDDENNNHHDILDVNDSNIHNGKIENVNEDENNFHDSEVNKDEINEESKEEIQSEFYEENQRKKILKEFDLEITSVEDGEEQEKVSKDKGNLKEILRKLQSLFFILIINQKNYQRSKNIIIVKLYLFFL